MTAVSLNQADLPKSRWKRLGWACIEVLLILLILALIAAILLPVKVGASPDAAQKEMFVSAAGVAEPRIPGRGAGWVQKLFLNFQPSISSRANRVRAGPKCL